MIEDIFFCAKYSDDYLLIVAVIMAVIGAFIVGTMLPRPKDKGWKE